jgi:predicted RNase H-like HicB family nuclease
MATGASRDAVLAEIRAAIAFHLEGLAADAEPQPRATAARQQHAFSWP